MLIEVFDRDDELINIAFNLDYQSKTHLKNLLNKIAAFDTKDKRCIEEIEFICEKYLGGVFKKKTTHSISSVKHLLIGNDSDIFNILYRICWRCLNADNDLLEY